MTTKEILDHVYERLDFLSKETWVTMICKHLTTDDLEQMLDNNELTPRFFDEQKGEEAIKNYWGERCPDHDDDCVVCQAWQEFDTGDAA